MDLPHYHGVGAASPDSRLSAEQEEVAGA